MSDGAEELALAFELVELARSIAIPRFKAQDFTRETKGDGSPVTEVDVAVELAQRELLAERRPDHMIVGEERGVTGESPWCWYLDPIDGTARFVAADPGWMSLVALARDGQVTLGVVDRPVAGERWWATLGGPALRDGAPIHVSERRTLREAIVNDSWREDIARGNRDHPLVALATRAGAVRPHRDHATLAVACGEADVALSIGGGPWDYAPMKAIVEAAGGRFTDLQGRDRVDTGAAVATNGLIHDEVLGALGIK